MTPAHTSEPAGGPEVDWARLRDRARDMMSRAYAPYSGFPVGAAALVDDGRTVAGCNVENAAYGVALCAECGLVSALHATGGGRLTAFTCCDRHGERLMPCGRCRQLLWEHGGPGMLVDTAGGVRTLAELLPYAFGAADLAEERGDREGLDLEDRDGEDRDG
ncbi:cytidine deaminase [Streptomyces armeniacus]|uniref:Cytidine deaminase n=1 Tax=Streptomyces armeniacus TaxID=83291 RepID=A0A345XWE4_9ACTN|nr:cytidine deaminase [Streptomyces armeniacus]AXK35960.1 cytidine deaminase [Streptomyces armeniacus]